MTIYDYYQNIELTGDQEKTLEAVDAFLNDDVPVFRLTGYAGTGKTTLMQGLCQYLKHKYRSFSLMAPTGRAAMVLTQRTGQEASTIHRAIYNMDDLLENKEGTSFKYYYGLDQNWNGSDHVYIVDEASMISDVFSDQEFFIFGSGHLLKDLFRYVFEKYASRKIIFIGDDAQLPPVGMNFSPALDGGYLQTHYGADSSGTVMKQVVRQVAGSNILKVAGTIRQSLEQKSYNLFRIEDGSDIQRLDLDEVISHYSQLAKENGVSGCTVVTHSNRQAMTYNEMIREKRYGDREAILQKHDWLIVTHNNYNLAVDLYNGAFVRVVAVGEIVYTASPRFRVEGGKSVERKLSFREVSIEVKTINGSLEVLDCTLLEEFLTSEKAALHPWDQRALYIDFKDRMKKMDIPPGTKEFKMRMKIDRFFNAVQAKYGYAITCHKSQGGEWPYVMVDFNVFTGRQTSGFFRWAYTAMTRAGRRLYAINVSDFSPLSSYQVKDIEALSKVLPGMHRYPEEGGVSFVDHRKERLQSICREQRVVMEIRNPQYQLEVKFQFGEEEVLVRLWYSKKGFTRTTWEKTASAAFNMLVDTILFESLLPGVAIPFEEKFPFQGKMKKFFQGVLQEENTPLTNIVQREWCDEYYFKTGADCAMVEFWYNRKEVFTYAQPKSTLGAEDQQLQSIVKRLRGIKE